jgi:hypothetical protein
VPTTAPTGDRTVPRPFPKGSRRGARPIFGMLVIYDKRVLMIGRTLLFWLLFFVVIRHVDYFSLACFAED